ncbi:MAG: hypothetical protein A3C43_06600 [Candidatus Schekmanbacteria bacterium RIFCSPHIGHO2_02_FULL_38_11]|uniref:Glycosyltransferase family 1 protein n=1 Tax=Candidatus Schekmanbacteria bacterium RIFCSPLOWO2_12_FULL_38_15 TaxID=1817883 RepID=A0A1F7SDF6_9BACT|nr:MAG: hypothetical protein A2043_07560 [Candidatus Schekmanbacteria bacterium GWA2_38_9]OGL49585.1 MAG: hypothetical protein A3C43_06600 [Candidatus Schekmanbacteria bacterium RIFCSPHIGHO2_02_FULL_38_11]OGL51473.1 MAG: hypothetical protein A3H37_12225 [Candidatus Schekmanbacteria bacterium RIFCSPLOWO2_02_FULL_38_14]OGL51823.1 MAG: hypothetical protein A3G31_12630 [Candidatus Schekmanbacteria bacterium RIFCSPLOWO2_12_FULL_38_15]
MRKLRILQTNMHRGGWGGQPHMVLLIAKKIRDKGHFVLVAAPKGSTLVKRAREEGIDTYDDLTFQRGFHPFILFSELFKLKRVIERYDIDILHTHGSQDTWAGALSSIFIKKNLILIRTRHNTFQVKYNLFNRLLYKYLIDKLFIVSSGVKKEFEKFIQGGELSEKRILTIHPGIDLNTFNLSLNGKKIRDELSLDGNKILIGVIGRLAKEKGHIFFLKAAAEVAKKINEARFLIVGEGPLRKELEEESVRLGLEGKILFLGFRSDIPEINAALDISVLPSIACESASLVIKESMALKKAVISTSFPGVTETIADGENGVIVPPGDHTAMADAMIRIISNQEIRKRLGEKGRQTIEKNFTEDVFINRIEEAYYNTMIEKGFL